MVKAYSILAYSLFRKMKYLFLFLTLVLMSCDKENSKISTITDIENEKEVIKETLNKMWLAIENEEIDKYASYIHPDFSQFGEYDSILRKGKKAEVKAIHNWIKESSKIHTEMKDPIVTIKDDVAWITYYWSDNGTTNGEPFASTGKSTRIFVKEDDKWLCIHGHYTLLTN